MTASTWDVGSGPGITALGLACARAVEGTTPDRLIQDPYAPWFVEAAGVALPMLTHWPEPGTPVTEQQALHLHGSRYIGLRSRFYDDWLREAADAGVRQAVLLGSGLDTRAFRLDWPTGFRIFELDQAGVLDFKTAVLAARGAEAGCGHVPVGADLREQWPELLLGAGFDPSAATAWLAEGLLAYLPAQAESELFERIDALCAPGSRVAFDRILGDLGRPGDARLRQLSERSGVAMDTLVNTEQRADTLVWLDGRGWKVEERSATVLAERYGRDLRDPFGQAKPGTGPDQASASEAVARTEPPWLETAFVTARRAA